MSIKVMSWVWDNSQTKGAHKLVLLALADQANDDGFCWPAIPTIARRCGDLSDRYVQYILADLVKTGELEIIRRRDNGKNKSNLYRVVVKQGSPGGETEFTTPGETGFTIPDEVEFTRVVKQGSPDPSFNRNSFNPKVEPSAEAVAAAPPPTEPIREYQEELKLLYQAGVYEPTAAKIVKIPGTTSDYLTAHIAQAKDDRVSTGILITRLLNHDPPPLSPELQDEQDRLRYVDSEFAEFIEH